MQKWAYYNDTDPFAQAWTQKLIQKGLVAPGVVDDRSIEDVLPEDLKEFTQCHFFSGIAVWSLALRQAGFSDDRPVWTGSCPCQPFSAAGKGNGFADERHLWPAFHWLIEQCRPELVVGEQVASKDGLHWLDLVQADLEGAGYASGALDTCAAGFGSPHLRQRLYWVGYAKRPRLEGYRSDPAESGWYSTERSAADTGGLVRLAQPTGGNYGGRRDTGRSEDDGSLAVCGETIGLADAYGEQHDRGRIEWSGRRLEHPDRGELSGLADTASGQSCDRDVQRGGEYGQQPQDLRDRPDGRIPVHPLNYWRDTDWLLCRDPDGPRFRPVESGSFPLVDARSLRNRLGGVRGAGNAINLAQAQGFIEAVMECLP